MSLSAGTRLGPYEVLAPIGAGGMGEVYKARDTKLDRLVAIKVLPDALASDAERLSRFEREARTLAALNHPNVAQIYGIEESSGVRALVMELVSGAPVQGPLPPETVVSYAQQIANALEAAHEKGIVHRDLKPANILVARDGVVKVLDFGLAMMAQTSRSEDPASSPTVTMPLTNMGVIMGTAAYMSPEQARGQTVDRRSDIWSFGEVLAELIAGSPVFQGDTVPDILVKVLGKEPDLSALPPNIRYVAQRCLRHDPRKRWQAIGDARMALEEGPPEAATAPAQSFRSKRDLLPWAAAGALALVAAGTSLMAWRATRSSGGLEARPLVRLDADLGPELHQPVAYAQTTVAISPDGTRLIYPVRDPPGTQVLASRLLDQPTAIPVAGTEGGFGPFFSPDGQAIGFFADGKLKRIALNGGVPVTLAEATNPRGASWGEDGTIVAALTNTEGLYRIPAAGGSTPRPLTQLRGAEATHRWPQVLPGGQAVLFTSNDNVSNYEGATLEVVSLKTGERRVIQTGAYFGRFTTSGHLLYIHNGQLFALRMSGVAAKAQGAPVEILNDVASSVTSAAGRFDVSRTGVFVYDSGRAAPETWLVAAIDANGVKKKQPQLSAPGAYLNVRYSPDGQRLVLGIETKGLDIYTYNLKSDVLSRITFTGKQALGGIWAPDAQHLVFESVDGGRNKMMWARTDGTGGPQELLERQDLSSCSISADGRRVAYHERSGTNYDIWTLPLDLTDPDHPKPGKPEPFAQTPANERHPVFSPDQRWLAYDSDESGTYEIYVRPFPNGGTGGKWQVSFGGGTSPRWARDGKRLFFETPDNHIMVADYTVHGNSLEAAKPRLWSDQQLVSPTADVNYDISPDGTTIEALVPAAEDNKPTSRVTFLLNFFDELRRRTSESR